jgi:hypothetical protein
MRIGSIGESAGLRGHFVAPYSLERYTSSNYFYYMERSPIFDAFFGPNQRQSGLMLFDSYFDDRVTLASSFTRVSKARLNSFAFDAEDGLYAAGIRMTALPIYADDGRFLLHIGGNYFRQSLQDNEFSVANRFPLRAGGGSQQVLNILRTGTFFTPDDANIADVEVAAVCSPLSLSGEYACVEDERLRHVRRLELQRPAARRSLSCGVCRRGTLCDPRRLSPV